jgi:hypothetical protein
MRCVKRPDECAASLVQQEQAQQWRHATVSIAEGMNAEKIQYMLKCFSASFRESACFL